MADIQIAITIMTVISGALFMMSLLLYRTITSFWRKTIVITVIALILVHLFFLGNSIWWIHILPVKGIIVYRNLLILLNGLLSGFVWGNRSLSALRRATAIGLLMFLAYLPTISQVYPVDVPYQDIWKDDICIQSSYTSCIPAAGATLLNYYDIDSNEEEMAHLCLTRYDGTSLFGLYRGLLIKTEHTQNRVTLGMATIEQLQKDILPPVILIVNLDEETNQQKPQYTENGGWLVGVSHSVVLFRFIDDDLIEIGDPSIGREIWSLEALDDLWHGEYILIE